MKRAKQQQINAEKIVLFNALWAILEKESNDIWGDRRQARDLACSEWKYNHLSGILEPVRIVPERTDLLDTNFSKIAEANSRQKYFLIETFLPTLKKLRVQLNSEQKAVYTYWKQELAKSDPELDNRFKSPQKKHDGDT